MDRERLHQTVYALLVSSTPEASSRMWESLVVDVEQYERLLRLDFVRTSANVLFRGPSGVGKTTLAQNIDVAALAAGHTVRFSTLAEALADLAR
jgi:DNA replication protein DnaC